MARSSYGEATLINRAGDLQAGRHPRLGKVLIVDDYSPNVVITGTYLDNFGFDYDVAETGMDAIRMAQTGQYAAILMDIQMPTMDGIETTHHIRNFEQQHHRRHTPIIAMTAHYMAADRDTCLKAGMDAYVTKPFQPDALEKMLGFMITESRH